MKRRLILVTIGFLLGLALVLGCQAVGAGETAVCAYEVLSGGDTNAPYSQAAGMHDKRVRWAGAAIGRTAEVAADVLKLVLAANAGLTVTQIQNATDAAIQGGVRGIIDEIAAAYVANAG